MLSSAFFLYSFLFVIAYGLQGAFQAGYIRKYDSLTVGLLRNGSLILTMAPLLFLAPLGSVGEISNHIGTLAFASGVGAIGLWLSFESAHYLPIGVGTALRHMTHAVTAVMLGAYLFHEYLTHLQLLFLGLTVSCGIALILLRVDYGHLNPQTVGRGIALTLSAGAVVALSFFLFSSLSRDVHPFVAAYFWEAGAGIYLLLFFLFRGHRTSFPTIPSRRDLLAIIGISCLTIIGTVGYALAVTHGPYALASGLMSLTTLVAIVLGRYLYHEKLTRLQIVCVLAAVVSTLLLKLVS